MSSRTRLIVAAGAIAAAGALAFWLFLGPLSPGRRLAAAISKATGMPCHIGSVRPAGAGFEIADLSLGAEPGLCLEVDRLVATGDLGRRELQALEVTGGRVRLVLPGAEPVRLTDVDVSAGNLGALTGSGSPSGSGRSASLAIGGHCFELNPILKERGGIRFLRGRFTLSCSMARPDGSDLDVPIRIILTDFHVQSLDRRFEGEAGSAEAVVRLTGSLREPRIDAKELAPFLGGVDISTRAKPAKGR